MAVRPPESERLEEELTAKAARLCLSTARLAVNWAIVLTLFDWRALDLPPLPSAVAFVVGWGFKGLWDVMEDVADEHSRPKVRRAALVLMYLFAGVPAVVLPAVHVTYFVMVSAMVLGSVVAGGIDTFHWAVAAGLCAAGSAWGATVWLPQLSVSDAAYLIAGTAVHALLSGIQDRILESTTLHTPPLLRFLLRLKVIPITACCLVALFAHSQTTASVLAFALMSPHFLSYDATKVLACLGLLQTVAPCPVHASVSAGVSSAVMRRLLLRLCVFLASGRRTVFVTDPAVAGRVVRSCEYKGRGLERYFALHMWDPVVSTESIDGRRWQRMRNAVVQALRALSQGDGSSGPQQTQTLAQRADAAIKAACHLHAARLDEPLDSAKLHLVLAAALHRLVFGNASAEEQEEADDEWHMVDRQVHQSVDENAAAREPGDVELWVAASQSWRARIAGKAPGDARVRQRAFARVRELLARAPPALRGALSELDDDAEQCSVIVQAFIVSPLINMTDSLVAVAALLNQQPRFVKDLTQPASARQVIHHSARRWPPFPVLERVLPDDWEANHKPFNKSSSSTSQHQDHPSQLQADAHNSPTCTCPWADTPGQDAWLTPGTHVFIESDLIAQRLGDKCASQDVAWLAFGAGKRACPGEQFAMHLFEALLRHAVVPRLQHGSSLDLFRPDQGHRFSGRLHDQEDDTTDALFFGASIASILATATWTGLKSCFTAHRRSR